MFKASFMWISFLITPLTGQGHHIHQPVPDLGGYIEFRLTIVRITISIIPFIVSPANLRSYFMWSLLLLSQQAWSKKHVSADCRGSEFFIFKLLFNKICPGLLFNIVSEIAEFSNIHAALTVLIKEISALSKDTAQYADKLALQQILVSYWHAGYVSPSLHSENSHNIGTELKSPAYYFSPHGIDLLR